MKHPACLRLFLQLLSISFLILTGCVSTSPPINLSPVMPEGYYMFDCPIVYEKDMAEITHRDGKAFVQLLGDFKGSFAFEISSEGVVTIVEDEMGFSGLNRSFNGEGQILKRGHARGEAIAWLKSIGGFSRDHRKGPWSIRPASESEINSYMREQKSLELRKQRARDGGLDI